MSATVDITLEIRNLEEDDVVEIWQRLNLVGQGFVRDGREVSVTTYRYTDDEDVEVTVGPPVDGAER